MFAGHVSWVRWCFLEVFEQRAWLKLAKRRMVSETAYMVYKEFLLKMLDLEWSPFMDSKSNIFIFTETPAFHVCWFAALAGGLLVDQYHPIARPEIWIQLQTPDGPLPRWLDKIPKVFTLHSLFFFSAPSTFSVFHYFLTSLLFPFTSSTSFFLFSSVCVFEVPACRQSTRATLSLQNVLAASPNRRIFRNSIGEYGIWNIPYGIWNMKHVFSV